MNVYTKENRIKNKKQKTNELLECQNDLKKATKTFPKLVRLILRGCDKCYILIIKLICSIKILLI